MIEKIIDIYYRLGRGTYNEDNRKKTKAVILYLIDNGFSATKITNLFNNIKLKDYLEPKDLPDFLWDNSLLKRDTFYFHNTLRLVSPAPTFNPETLTQSYSPFYIEMIINYTMDDLIKYYYETLKVDINLRDYNKDKGSLQYLLNKYERIKDIESIDVVLMLIDEMSNLDSCQYINTPLKLQDLEPIVINRLNSFIPEAIYNQANKIVWREL